MSKTNYTPNNVNEWPAGPFSQTCNGTKYYHKYAAVYEQQSNGKIAWWTHGIPTNANVFDPPGQCNCTQIGTDPMGNPIKACAPQAHAAHPLDYTGSNGNRHYFIAWGGSTPPAGYLLTDVG